MYRLVAFTLIFAFALFAIGQSVVNNAARPEEKALVLTAAAKSQGSFASEEMVIERSASGQFRIPAAVNGMQTEFLIDTGASVVALTIGDAARLGIAPAPQDFQPIVQTAAGPGKAARIRLDRIEIGGTEYRDVDAVVAEGLPVNLLGQSLLRRLGKVELRGDRMVIAHR